MRDRPQSLTMLPGGAGKLRPMELPPTDPAQTDRIYRALGRFIVNFSQLVGHMEAGLMMFARTGGPLDSTNAWRVGLTGIAADRLRVVFFVVASSIV